MSIRTRSITVFVHLSFGVVSRTHRIFKGGLRGHIRVLKSTDEAMLRDLFYNLSEESVYFRYFSTRRSMPQKNLQQYVNMTEDDGLSLVVTVGPREDRKIIGEARYMISPGDPSPGRCVHGGRELPGPRHCKRPAALSHRHCAGTGNQRFSSRSPHNEQIDDEGL